MAAPDEEIYVVSPDGSGLQQVTNDPGQWDFKTDWSPDGTLMAFAKSEGPDAQGDFPSRIDIEIVRPDGAGLRNLTQSITPAATFNSGPAWSPDGMRIAFSSGPSTGPGTAIDVVNVDGSGLRQLTSGEEVDLDPAWSPDGKWIAFSRNHQEIDLVRSDGSSERRLVTLFFAANTPQWSPDGTRIAFSEQREQLSDAQIAVVNTDASGLRTLTGPRLPAVHRCVVPRVVGKQLKDAQRMIRKSHCRVGRIRWKYERARKGKVLAQRPRPQRRLRAGARVNLVVSRGPIR